MNVSVWELGFYFAVSILVTSIIGLVYITVKLFKLGRKTED